MRRAWRWRFCLGLFAAISAAPAVAQPQPGIWVTYFGFGSNSYFSPRDGSDSGYFSVGDLRWPIFSVRIRDVPADRGVNADLVTPAGFDKHYVREADRAWITADESAETRLADALSHHRPALLLRLPLNGTVSERPSRHFERHRNCARRLLRESLEAQMRDPQNARRLDLLREWAEDEPLSRRTAPPVAGAALLLRLVDLPLPADDAARLALEELERRLHEPRSDADYPTQSQWLFAEARQHGRSVGRAIDLRVVRHTAQARLCRSLPYNRVQDVRTDTCRVEAVIDRRDGWPITFGIVREGRAANGATEMQLRRFNRVAPLEGFVPPANPCRG